MAQAQAGETMKLNETSPHIYDEGYIHQFKPGNTHKIQQQLQNHQI